MKFKRLLIAVFILISPLSLSQNVNNPNPNKTEFATKNQHWLDISLGLNFFISNQSALNEFVLITNEKPDYFGYLLQPKYQYFMEDKWCILGRV